MLGHFPAKLGFEGVSWGSPGKVGCWAKGRQGTKPKKSSIVGVETAPLWETHQKLRGMKPRDTRDVGKPEWSWARL